ncbi:hypothetical protein LTR86_006897 [Recurvomyces mirabilis]|nr:hypothetical protein LTR86_006897 [Recurvomyces mirabilis]
MVRITVTNAAKAAIIKYCELDQAGNASDDDQARLDALAALDVGSPIDHAELMRIAKSLRASRVQSTGKSDDTSTVWRLDSLLRGSSITQQSTPPVARPQQTAEYKALMQKLRADEERRQYDRMTHTATVPETFSQRLPNAPGYDFNPATSHGHTGNDEDDDMTFQDVNRQMILIINVLISIICCSVFIWVAARRWSVPQRLGLSMSGSGIVAFAEVAIYLGYIKRLGDAKQKERKALEKKEIVETWVIDKAKTSSAGSTDENPLRQRKGKHG